MKERFFVVVVVVALSALGFWIWLSNYDECRARGFSVLYCASHR